MKKIWGFLSLAVCAGIVAACDLQPRIMSLPDSVGDFIADRYPALLADPDSQPEIYNSAATDYGVYASPELYGSVESDDYILYSDINDYMMPAQSAEAEDVAASGTEEAPAQIVAEYSAPKEAEDDTDEVVVEDAPVAENAAVDDYLVVPMYGGGQDSHQIKVAAGDTLYAIARRYGATVEEIAKLNNLSAPYSIRAGQMLTVPGNGDIVVAPAEKAPVAVAQTEVPKAEVKAPVTSVPLQKKEVQAPVTVRATTPAPAPTPARVQLQTVTVGPGDTLYSISRRYSVPVNDLAVMNDLGAPFRLRVGQKLRVPNLKAAAVAAQAENKVVKPAVTPQKTATVKDEKIVKNSTVAPAKNANNKPAQKKDAPKQAETPKTAAKPKAKISSDPKQKLPTIAARSSSKFSWPVRGKILSAFGAKPNGLVNDGINIAANRGTVVKAAENGVVAYAGNEVKGMGNLIILQHSGGWMTVYAHLDSMALRRGARVNVGQKIGTVGASGKVDRPQLHFEIRKGTKAYNPSQHLKN